MNGQCIVLCDHIGEDCQWLERTGVQGPVRPTSWHEWATQKNNRGTEDKMGIDSSSTRVTLMEHSLAVCSCGVSCAANKLNTLNSVTTGRSKSQ